MSLDVDGSALQQVNQMGFGGLIRDDNGNFLMRFYGALGAATILHAKISALMHGLELCWAKGFQKILCHSKSLLTLKLLKEANQTFHRHGKRTLISHHWEVKINNVFTEANFYADVLAKLGAS